MKTETAQDKAVRADWKRAAALAGPPGRKGPAVYYWELDTNGFQVRMRRQVPQLWERYSRHQLIFDSFANEWDCCTLFGDDESDDKDDDIYPSAANVISENATGSTTSSQPPHDEPTWNLPPPHEGPTTSLPHHEEPTPNLSLLYEKSTPLHEDPTSVPRSG